MAGVKDRQTADDRVQRLSGLVAFPLGDQETAPELLREELAQPIVVLRPVIGLRSIDHLRQYSPRFVVAAERDERTADRLEIRILQNLELLLGSERLRRAERTIIEVQGALRIVGPYGIAQLAVCGREIETRLTIVVIQRCHAFSDADGLLV